MARLIPFAFVLALLCVWNHSAALAADKVDLTGTWLVEIEIAGQQGAPEFTLKQDGKKLTGTYKGQFGELDVSGTVKDDDVKISFIIQDGAEAVYTGTIQDDGTLKGEADYAGMAEGTWTAKRKKDE